MQYLPTVVLDDEKGNLIAPVIRNGRPDKGMPKLNLTEDQISDIIAWLHVQTFAADLPHGDGHHFSPIGVSCGAPGRAFSAIR